MHIYVKMGPQAKLLSSTYRLLGLIEHGLVGHHVPLELVVHRDGPVRQLLQEAPLLVDLTHVTRVDEEVGQAGLSLLSPQ